MKVKYATSTGGIATQVETLYTEQNLNIEVENVESPENQQQKGEMVFADQADKVLND